MADSNYFVPTEQGQGAPVAPQTAPAAFETQQPAYQQPAPQANERTSEQFEKLLESNRALHQQLQGLQQQMRAPQAPVQPVQQVQADPDSFVQIDPTTGERYVDEQKMQQTIRQLKEEAAQAKKLAQQVAEQNQQTEQQRQEREAFTAYPELNPDNKDNFNKGFHNQVRAAIFDSLMNQNDYGGKPLSFKEAADFVRSQYPQQPQVAMEQPKTEEPAANESALAEAQELKQQGSLDVSGQPNVRAQVQDTADLDALRMRTRYGDDEALARRLMGVDHVGTPPIREE